MNTIIIHQNRIIEELKATKAELKYTINKVNIIAIKLKLQQLNKKRN